MLGKNSKYPHSKYKIIRDNYILISNIKLHSVVLVYKIKVRAQIEPLPRIVMVTPAAFSSGSTVRAKTFFPIPSPPNGFTITKSLFGLPAIRNPIENSISKKITLKLHTCKTTDKEELSPSLSNV